MDLVLTEAFWHLIQIKINYKLGHNDNGTRFYKTKKNGNCVAVFENRN